jgi:dual-specificity kinase
MSTPSTATALAPIEIANLQYYGNYPLGLPNPYSAPSNSRLQAPPFYNPPTRSLTSNASIPSLGPTRTNSSAMVPPTGQPPASTSSPASRKRRSPPDWEKFYENGVPKEVIVIDDTPPPSAASSSARVGNGMVQYPVGTSAAHPAKPRHTDKKRKVETKAEYPYDHEQLYSQAGSVHPAYSTTQTPQRNAYNNSPATLSAQSSTGSVNDTTAGTSLGSNRSMNDALAAASLLPQANGGKRKRVTRASHAAAAAANTEDAFASYHPPPKPPIKAKEVHVNVIQDVRVPYRRYQVLQQACD